jgi:hypothetical protein
MLRNRPSVRLGLTFLFLLSLNNTAPSEGADISGVRHFLEKFLGWKDSSVSIDEVCDPPSQNRSLRIRDCVNRVSVPQLGYELELVERTESMC